MFSTSTALVFCDPVATMIKGWQNDIPMARYFFTDFRSKMKVLCKILQDCTHGLRSQCSRDLSINGKHIYTWSCTMKNLYGFAKNRTYRALKFIDTK